MEVSALRERGGACMETIIAAVITGGITLIGVLIANSRTQAVMQVKVDELTREVREHNNFAKRMPVVENQLETIQKDIEELYSYHKPSV
jgi:low affinity Fe/Cu permease